ncbi:MAG: DUF1570 domain-containing protein [Planctomycetota bacterium]|nr:MAG: DUF1570 domain-containing protein [Planctomycetota bacterium]
MQPPALVVGAAVVGAAILAAAQAPAPPSAHAADTLLLGRPVSHEQAKRELTLGDDAVQQGALAQADAHYRLAWGSPQVRAAAAQRLWRLHERRDYVLPVPQQQVQETRRALSSDFSLYETPHFVMLTDASRAAAVKTASLLERTRERFFRVMRSVAPEAAPPATKLLCVLFADEQAYRDFAREFDRVEAPWVAGYYASVSNRIVLYDDATSSAVASALEALEQQRLHAQQQARHARRQGVTMQVSQRDLNQSYERRRRSMLEQARSAATEKVVHETTHLLAFNSGVQSRLHSQPFWLTEGLATAFETDRPEQAFGPAQPSPRRQAEAARLLADELPLPLRELVSLTDVSTVAEERIDALYAASYALFVYLHRRQRRALGRYLAALGSEPPGEIASQRLLELFEDNFGDADRLERTLLRWLRTLPDASRSSGEGGNRGRFVTVVEGD